MRNFKKYATTLALAGIIMMGASSARAGLLMSDFASNGSQPCTSNSHARNGLLMSDLARIITGDFTGIIVNLQSTDCGRSTNGILLGGG